MLDQLAEVLLPLDEIRLVRVHAWILVGLLTDSCRPTIVEDHGVDAGHGRVLSAADHHALQHFFDVPTLAGVSQEDVGSPGRPGVGIPVLARVNQSCLQGIAQLLPVGGTCTTSRRLVLGGVVIADDRVQVQVV